MANPVGWFEVLGPDGSGLQRFYAEAFGWQIDADNPMSYGMAAAEEGGIGGGVAGSPDGKAYATFYIAVPDLQAALDAPCFHTNHFASSFYPREAHPRQVEVEARFPGEVVDELRRRGHDVVATGDWSLGRVSAVAREAGLLKAAANPRGMQGYAVGR